MIATSPDAMEHPLTGLCPNERPLVDRRRASYWETELKQGQERMASIRESTLTRVQIASLVALFTLCGAAVLHEVYVSPDAPFLTQGTGGSWIGYPFVPSSNAVPVLRDSLPAYSFTKSFTVGEEPTQTLLTARGLTSLQLSLNGSILLWDPPLESWKDIVEIDITDQLVVGSNEIHARVRNATGPSLLQLAIRNEAINIETNSSWDVASPGIVSTKATVAKDGQLFSESFVLPGTQEIFARYGFGLGIVFLLAAGLSAAIRKRAPAINLERLPVAVLIGATLYWLAVFAIKISQLPVMMGFDIPAHLEYLDYLIETRSLPDATEGWSTYHPPLFYLLTAALVVATDVARESAAGQVVYRIVCFSSGLATVWAAYFCARRFFDRDPVKIALATAFAAILPMNLYVSAYVSNESLLAALIAIATLASCNALMAAQTTQRQIAVVGVALGLAIATKFSGLMVVPVFAGVIATKIGMLDGQDRTAASKRGIAAFVSIVALTALVGGGYYLRNYLQHNEWVIWNVNLPGTTGWWEFPGFHTASYYLSFGESLRHPFFSGFSSFWDGIYSTFWGDGLLAGMVRAETRHPFWNYDLMTLGYWTALPLTAILCVGIARLLTSAFRDPSMNVRIAASFMVVVIFIFSFSLFIVTFRVPYYAQAKAFYVLGATLPLSMAAASGLVFVDQWLAKLPIAPLRAFYHGTLTTSVAVIVMTYLG
ncbi:MAG: hypothetical protein ACI8W3_003164 [Myxococcota bacterium]|jgi:hypothetical protein